MSFGILLGTTAVRLVWQGVVAGKTRRRREGEQGRQREGERDEGGHR